MTPAEAAKAIDDADPGFSNYLAGWIMGELRVADVGGSNDLLGVVSKAIEAYQPSLVTAG